ncbi:MAG TPA: efflux RND transporter periplasmic adaptor subunit, partial [Ferrovaceae bacterium]|nr:efflux RND transporter periplasmic adaptor subunit [Ferrovaceae bacterium]
IKGLSMIKSKIIRKLVFLYCLVIPISGFSESTHQHNNPVSLNAFDAEVQSIHQAEIAAQVSGRVLQINVVAGQKVRAGETLLNLDSSAAQPQAVASEAQISSANADLTLAQKDYQRQEALFKEDYISQAALDRAQSKLEAAKAHAKAILSLAHSARAQANFYIIKAPFDGVISEVPINQGDMAMPGRVLVTLYDPHHLRVSAAVPSEAVRKDLSIDQVKIDVPTLSGPHQELTPQSLEVFPTVDNSTHTVLLRVNIQQGHAEIKPGQFARLWLPTTISVPNKVIIPITAVVERGEMTGVYVKNEQGEPLLRQVRLGRRWGSDVEVISGLSSTQGLIENVQSLSFGNTK